VEVINFYRVGDAYGCFSNFAPYPIMPAGRLWPTSEHYFPAQKFHDLLVEHTTNNSYWGDGGDGSGRIMPGQILMRVQAELRQMYPIL